MGISGGFAGPVLAGMAGDNPLNALSAEEAKAGWILLFDGKTTDGWRRDSVADASTGWVVDRDALTRPVSSGSPQYIITREQYENFELNLEWSIQEWGDGGLFWRLWAGSDIMWNRGPEFQIVDQWRKSDGISPEAVTGACAFIYPPFKDAIRPIGEYNQVRLVVHGHHVEHWLNGEKILTFEVGSKDWIARLKISKFINQDRMGVGPLGYIGLQALTTQVRFRNIKLLRLPPGEPAAIRSIAARAKPGGAWKMIMPGESLLPGLAILDAQGRMLGRPYRMIPASSALIRR